MSLIGNDIVYDEDIEGSGNTSFFTNSAYNDLLGRADAIAYHFRITRASGIDTDITFNHRWGNDGQNFPTSSVLYNNGGPVTSPFEKGGDTGTSNLGRFGQVEAAIEATGAFSAHLTIYACTRTR